MEFIERDFGQAGPLIVQKSLKNYVKIFIDVYIRKKFIEVIGIKIHPPENYLENKYI